MLKARLIWDYTFLPTLHLIFALFQILIGEAALSQGAPPLGVVISGQKSHFLVGKKTTYDLSLYRAMANTAAELTWMSFILRDLRIPLFSPLSNVKIRTIS